MTSLGSTVEATDEESQCFVPKAIALVFAVMTGYLIILAVMLSLLEPQGLVWTVTTAGIGLGLGTPAFLLFRRAGAKGLTKLLGKDDDTTS